MSNAGREAIAAAWLVGFGAPDDDPLGAFHHALRVDRGTPAAGAWAGELEDLIRLAEKTREGLEGLAAMVAFETSDDDVAVVAKQRKDRDDEGNPEEVCFVDADERVIAG